MREELKTFGRLLAVRFMHRNEAGGKRSYRYRLKFEQVSIRQPFVFDLQNKIEVSIAEAMD